MKFSQNDNRPLEGFKKFREARVIYGPKLDPGGPREKKFCQEHQRLEDLGGTHEAASPGAGFSGVHLFRIL